jgi:hypothetical protein
MIPAIEAERIPLARAGKVIESGRKTPEIDVKWKQYSGRSRGKAHKNGRKSPKKIQKLSDQNAASIFH